MKGIALFLAGLIIGGFAVGQGHANGFLFGYATGELNASTVQRDLADCRAKLANGGR